MSEQKFSPILPYQDDLTDGFIIYDRITYRRDLELTDVEIRNNHCESMIKYYSVNEKEPVKVGGD